MDFDVEKVAIATYEITSLSKKINVSSDVYKLVDSNKPSDFSEIGLIKIILDEAMNFVEVISDLQCNLEKSIIKIIGVNSSFLEQYQLTLNNLQGANPEVLSDVMGLVMEGHDIFKLNLYEERIANGEKLSDIENEHLLFLKAKVAYSSEVRNLMYNYDKTNPNECAIFKSYMDKSIKMYDEGINWTEKMKNYNYNIMNDLSKSITERNVAAVNYYYYDDLNYYYEANKILCGILPDYGDYVDYDKENMLKTNQFYSELFTEEYIVLIADPRSCHEEIRTRHIDVDKHNDSVMSEYYKFVLDNEIRQKRNKYCISSYAGYLSNDLNLNITAQKEYEQLSIDSKVAMNNIDKENERNKILLERSKYLYGSYDYHKASEKLYNYDLEKAKEIAGDFNFSADVFNKLNNVDYIDEYAKYEYNKPGNSFFMNNSLISIDSYNTMKFASNNNGLSDENKLEQKFYTFNRSIGYAFERNFEEFFDGIGAMGSIILPSQYKDRIKYYIEKDKSLERYDEDVKFLNPDIAYGNLHTYGTLTGDIVTTVGKNIVYSFSGAGISGAFLTYGISGFGDSSEKAYKSGATYGEGILHGVGGATIETMTNYLLYSKSVNANNWNQKMSNHFNWTEHLNNNTIYKSLIYSGKEGMKEISSISYDGQFDVDKFLKNVTVANVSNILSEEVYKLIPVKTSTFISKKTGKSNNYLEANKNVKKYLSQLHKSAEKVKIEGEFPAIDGSNIPIEQVGEVLRMSDFNIYAVDNLGQKLMKDFTGNYLKEKIN